MFVRTGRGGVPGARGRSRCLGGVITASATARRHAMTQPIQTATAHCERLRTEIGTRVLKMVPNFGTKMVPKFGTDAGNLGTKSVPNSRTKSVPNFRTKSVPHLLAVN